MKFYIILFFLINLSIGYSNDNPDYDSTYANKLNADDYGMKSYIFVVLKTGTATNVEKSIRDSLFKGHMSNMKKMADDGMLVVAGPFGKNADNYRGLFILNIQDIEEARKIVQTDPAVLGNLLQAEFYPWYGSAALLEINRIHKKIQKSNF